MARAGETGSKGGGGPDFARDLRFYLNGEQVTLRDPDPSLMLVDWLRSTEVGLTGTKKACGQGGCGACTVMLATWDAEREAVEIRSINSCIHPLVALDGTAVTTTEGLGSVDSAVNPVQYRIAKDNGSQCGYCTPGWVMNMTSYLAANPGKKLTQAEIEGIFDGNLCRCTGYRPILYAMKHFAADWGPDDERDCMKTLVDPGDRVKVCDSVEVGFPDALRHPARPVRYRRDDYDWYRPVTLDGLYRLMKKRIAPENRRLVVGNTSSGVYDRWVSDPHLLIDVSQIPELHGIEIRDDGFEVGAAVTYTRLIELLDELLDEVSTDPPRRTGLEALAYLAGRTAGTIVRNAASLAGNTMMVVTHVAKGTGEPFPSDLFTALCAVGARLRVGASGWNEPREYGMLEFAERYNSRSREGGELRRHGVLLSYLVPWTRPGTLARTFKVAIRHENAHSIVNAGMRVRLADDRTVEGAAIIYGGIGPIAFHAETVEQYLAGRVWNEETLAGALSLLRKEVRRVIRRSRSRMREVPFSGFTDDFRVALTESFLYQFFVYVLEQVDPGTVPPRIRTAGERYRRPVTRGHQYVQEYRDEYPVSYPFVKLSAFMQATGEAKYTHDLPLPVRGLQGGLVTSMAATAQVHYRIPGGEDDRDAGPVSLDDLTEHLQETFPDVANYVTYRDVPGKLYQGEAGDEPIFLPMENAGAGPVGVVSWFGQAIGMVLAKDERVAQDAAHYVANECLVYDREAVAEPVLTIEEAREKGLIFPDEPPFPTHIWKITREGSDLAWTAKRGRRKVAGVDCLVIHARHESDAQTHFYMETQSCLVEPQEHHQMVVHPSSQSPDSIMSGVMQTLNPTDSDGSSSTERPAELVPTFGAADISVQIKRLGGAYGGKTTRSPFFSSTTAVAAWKMGRPVRLALPREVDTATVGKRHPLLSEIQIAIGTGKDDPDNKGKLVGYHAAYWTDGGYTYDCSFVVLDCLQLRSDTAYMVPNYQSEGEVCKTNKASNTAYRAFGLIQSMLAYEDAIERAAEAVGMLAEDVRAKNLYRLGDTTPYGEVLDYCYMGDVFDYARKVSDFDARLEEVHRFNVENRWRKRGLCLMPLKYGSGYNATFLEQGGALLEVYDEDGTVLIRQGGVEMGQGVMTKVSQLAAQALNLPLGMLRIAETDTSVVPNPVSTGASTGTALNGGAVQKAGRELRSRIESYCLGLLSANGSKWCQEQGINFWDYEEGWRAEVNGKLMWQTIVSKANSDRVNLSAQVRYQQPGGGTVDTGLTFHPGATEVVQNFVGFTYNAACSEVEIDVLTGETFVRRCDVVYDMGKSLNPAIDVGQVEGAFVQGMGYVLTEQNVFQPDGPDRGRLNTLNTWTYKPPATSTIPELLNVHLYPRERSSAVPENPNDLMSAKEVGEPPLVLAVSVFCAVKKAILQARKDRGLKGWFDMPAPATVERVRTACAVRAKDLRI